jgi:hypothetical protein
MKSGRLGVVTYAQVIGHQSIEQVDIVLAERAEIEILVN